MTRPPRRSWVAIAAFAMAVAALAAFPAVAHSGGSAANAETDPVVAKLTATEDAFVKERTPDFNGGEKKVLATRVDPAVVSLVKFHVPTEPGEISEAVLKLKVKAIDGAAIVVNATDNAWAEADVTYRTAPDIAEELARVEVPPGSARWVSINVSKYITGPGTYSFAITGRERTRTTVKSTESPAAPVLKVTSVVPPTTTTTAPTTTTTSTTTTTTTTTTTGPPAGGQPAPPITAAFMYPWFSEAWDQGGRYPHTQFTPSLGLYDSSDPQVIDQQVAMATDAGLEAFIASWWGRGHHTDSATIDVLERIPLSPNPDFRMSIYYEEEGQSDPSVATIVSDLEYLERLFDQPAYLRVDGAPVVFVWATGDGSGMAARWAEAKAQYGKDLHVVLKVYSGFQNDPNQPDSWHQYGPATAYDDHLPWSAVVSPGFWHANETNARLSRDPGRFRADVQAMVDSGAFWQLVTSWNEWGEGTSVEPAEEFGTAYLDILSEELGTGGGTTPPPPTTTTTTTMPPPTTTTTTTTPPPTTTTTTTMPPAPGGGVVFAAGGDFGATSGTDATLASIGSSDAEFLLALGDLAYDDATPSQWCAYVKSYLGSSFPVELLVGNHEDDDRVDGYIGDFAACLPDRMGSTGTYAAEYFFDVDGLARVIMIGAGNDVAGVKYDYEVGNVHYQWLESTIDQARAAGIPWVIVGAHKPCITAGNKSCEVGTDLYDLLLEKKVDLILHGHDHDYQRSKQLTCATPDTYVAGCVADSGADDHYSKGAGSVFMVVGNTGGGGLTDIDTGDSEIGYLAAWHGGNSPDPGRGYARFTLSADRLDVEFVGTTTSYTDTFTID